ncbi:MAG: response regulator transcription factor [Saprospiraceae bacterium]|nr:response regulator transcription factor [Saprospiraceae bacterium]
MKRINAVIIDDEITAAHTLRGMLAEFCPMVNVIQVANDIESALRIVEQYRPEVVFLDIEMPPHGTGFDFLNQTQHLSFGVIFTTAYPHYAVKAINDVQPWAYLVKPYKTVELIQAVHIAAVKTSQLEAQANNRHRGFVLGDMRKGSVVVRFADLIFCQADGSCTTFFIQRDGKLERYSMYKNLKDMEADLPDSMFCRVHHGFIVNMAYIQRYERQGRAGKIHLAHDLSIDLSAQKMEHFVRHFNQFLRGVDGR